MITLWKDYVLPLQCLYDSDFLSRRRQKWKLLGEDEILSLIKNKYPNNSNTISDGSFLELIDNPLIRGILKKYPNRVYMAGGKVCEILNTFLMREEFRADDVDLFICENSQKEATKILLDIHEMIKEEVKSIDTTMYQNGVFMGPGGGHIELIVFRSKGAVSFNLYYVDAHTNTPMPDEIVCKIQVILRLYSDPSQIIGMFDIGPAQLMISAEEGLQATKMGMYCNLHQVQFVDPTRRSPSFYNRLEKYFRRNFIPICPNIRPTQYGSFVGNDLSLIDEVLINWEKIQGRAYIVGTNKEKLMYESDYIDDYHAQFASIVFKKSEQETFAIPLPCVGDELSPSSKLIWDFFIAPTEIQELIEAAKMNPRTIDKVIDDPIHRLAIKSAKFLEYDQEKARLLWSEALSDWCDLVGSFLPSIFDENFWKISNPGEQGGGSFRPTTFTGREYWNPALVAPIVCGIPHETYFVLKLMWKKMTWDKGLLGPKDIFNLLCYYIIEANSERLSYNKKEYIH